MHSIIDFSEELQIHFGTVLNEMKRFSLSWIYDYVEDVENRIKPRRQQVVKIPQNILSIAATIKNINGNDTLQGTSNLFSSLSILSKPFPSFLRIIPSIYAFWNAVKGGSNTTTKLMDRCATYISHVNCETAASNRCVMLLFVSDRRLFQLITSKPDLNKYSSLCHFRKASSK